MRQHAASTRLDVRTPFVVDAPTTVTPRDRPARWSRPQADRPRPLASYERQRRRHARIEAYREAREILWLAVALVALVVAVTAVVVGFGALAGWFPGITDRLA